MPACVGLAAFRPFGNCGQGLPPMLDAGREFAALKHSVGFLGLLFTPHLACLPGPQMQDFRRRTGSEW